MKTFFAKPGFEFIFSLALIAILALPPVLRAQTQKDLEIKIENGDTTINGKNIKDLSPTERHDAIKDINHLSGAPDFNSSDSAGNHSYFFKRRDTAGGRQTYIEFRKRRQGNNDRQPMITGTVIIRDSTGNVTETRMDRRRMTDRNLTWRRDERPMGGMRMREGGPGQPFRSPMMRFDHRNSQYFDYTTTDGQGMSTHISFRVSEPEHEDLEKITGVEGAKLEITDLNLVALFSTGKTLVMFNLPSKSPAEVFLKDGEGKLIWSDKCTGGSFSKSFILPLNGIYYLHIKQGSSANVKKIVKEE